MKKFITIASIILTFFLYTSLFGQETRNFPEIQRNGTLYGGILVDDGINGLTFGAGYFQEYQRNIHIGGTLAYTLGDFVFLGGTDLKYVEITPSMKVYNLFRPIRDTHIFLQAGISFNDIEYNNGDTDDQVGFKFGVGGFRGNREYLLMYNYINMDGKDRKYLSLTMAYFFY